MGAAASYGELKPMEGRRKAFIPQTHPGHTAALQWRGVEEYNPGEW